MPPDLPNEQELNLKKRARRRLVGAIALVLLMVIVLPQVLQDRATLTQQEAIKITMPDTAADLENSTVSKANESSQPHDIAPISEEPLAVDEPAAVAGSQSAEPALDHLIASKEAEAKAVEASKPEVMPAAEKIEKKEQKKPAEVKTSEIRKTEFKPAEKVEPKATEPKVAERFTVQVGVYSDAANVKRLQEQLKQAGYATSTEKVTTAKGESIRLKAGDFKSRQDAVTALEKLKAIGLSGIVIGNN